MTAEPHTTPSPLKVKPRHIPRTLARRGVDATASADMPSPAHGASVQPGAPNEAAIVHLAPRRRIVPALPARQEWQTLLEEVDRGRRHIERLQSKCSRALKDGDLARAQKFQGWILKSDGGALWAAFKADRKLRKKNKQRPRDARLVRRVAQQVNLYRPCAEQVRISFKRKRSGQYRAICSYEIENRARQYLATFAFKPFSAQRENQFDSRDKAIDHVSAALSSGSKWVVQVDLKDCFGSLDVNRLAALIPLPDNVTRHVIAEPPRDARVMGHTPGNSLRYLGATRTRLGLPTGSASASAIANHLIAHALREMPALGVTVFYVDDGCFLVNTRKQAEQIKDALYRVFSDDGPVGHIAFKHCVVRRASYGFDFLGYHIRRVAGETEIIPSEGKTAIVRAAVAHFLNLNREHARLRAYARGWCTAHRHWEHVDGFRDHLLNRIDEAERLGRDPSPPYGNETMVQALRRFLSRFQEDERPNIRDALIEGIAVADRFDRTLRGR